VKSTLDLQALDERDHKRLENIRILTDLLNAGRSNGSIKQSSGSGNTGSLPFGKLIEEASKRRQALARVGLRFGGSLVNVQAERLRERSGNSELTKQLALSSAETLDALAEAISNVDRNLSKQR
jgi:hypothetical protein